MTERIEVRRYFIGESVIDNIISQGGEMTITDTQFQSFIQDKTIT